MALLQDVSCSGNCSKGLYVGQLIDYVLCGQVPHCPVGGIFASGQLYFLSTDLVHDISKLLLAGALVRGNEDVVTGRHIEKLRRMVKFVNIGRMKGFTHDHPQKVNAPRNFLTNCKD